MQQTPKEPEKDAAAEKHPCEEEDKKEKGAYYYDDAHGYETYKPEKDDEDDED